jgi:FixJ family two-component response regulator
MRIVNSLVGFRRGEEKNVEDAMRARSHLLQGSLLIEDDERLRQELVFQLGTAGFQVVPYSSAEEFLVVSDATSFDCIVVDNFLPRMTGLQLQAQLSRTVPFASIVFISGNSELSLGMHAMRKGAVDFLEKTARRRSSGELDNSWRRTDA